MSQRTIPLWIQILGAILAMLVAGGAVFGSLGDSRYQRKDDAAAFTLEVKERLEALSTTDPVAV
jgi:hypothetical protein